METNTCSFSQFIKKLTHFLLLYGALYLGEACIESEGRWFTPNAFEEFGGRASSKKWKSTIHYRDKSLQHWIQVRFFVLYAEGTTPIPEKVGAMCKN